MENLKYLMALVGAAFGYIFGALDGLMIALIVFVIVDYITGVMDAIYNKSLSSAVGFKGIFKKVCIFILVAIGNIIDLYILKSGSPVRTSIIFFYISNEGISILENIDMLGVPLPEKLRDILMQIKEN